jgi:hypothetical protein
MCFSSSVDLVINAPGVCCIFRASPKMAPLTETETGELSDRILQRLLQTQYACSSLAQMSGGTANFVFRGLLTEPLPHALDGIETGTAKKTVIVKHSAAFLSVNRDFAVDASRCVSFLGHVDTPGG